jgi:hypothetical protein
MDIFPLDQPLLRMKFLARTILYMSSLQCPDGITYASQVADMAHMKQALDGVCFNFDEIFVALQLFYFQTQDGLVFKKVTSAIADIVRPLTDASQIDHKVLTAHIIRIFHEYGPSTAKAFKVATTGSAQPNPGCKGCPQHCRHANGTWRFPLRVAKSANIMLSSRIMRPVLAL